MPRRGPQLSSTPQPSLFFPVRDLIVILLCAYFDVESIHVSEERPPTIPFCNASERHFELSRLVRTT